MGPDRDQLADMGRGMPVTCAQWGLLFQKDWERGLIQVRSVEVTRGSFSHSIVIFVYGEGGCACDIETQLQGRWWCLLAQSCLTLRLHGLEPTSLLCAWDFPGKNTGVGCHFFLQGMSPTQGLNPHFLLGRQILSQWSHLGSPRRGVY